MKVLKAPQSGSQAGTTASHNRFGQYERNRRAPVQPIGTGRRAVIRAAFGAASNAFSSLTDAQIAAWQAYADAHPITDSLGQSVTLTGHMAFVGIGVSLQNIGLPISDDPPVSSTVAPLAPTGIYVDTAPTVILLATSPDAAAYTLGGASRPVSAAVTFMKTFNQLNVIQPTYIGIDVSDLYVAQFGAPAAGQRVYTRLTPVNADGVTGTPSILSTRTAAASAIPTPVATSAASGDLTATWTGGGSYTAYAFLDVLSDYPLQASAAVATAASPQTITGLPTGVGAVMRLTDGVSWGPRSNPIVVMT